MSATGRPSLEPSKREFLVRRWLVLALACGIGTALGIGGFAFRYAEGLSYFGTAPSACANCHIMQPQLDAWQKSSHHAVAVCIDCHLPTDFVRKYYVKAENGYRHGKLFTTQTFVEPIVVQAKGRAILEENCVRCHGGLVSELAPGATDAKHAVSCVRCHSGVGHGEAARLGGRLTRRELEISHE
jgi:cytochrome c nitrite reductase small subunit